MPSSKPLELTATLAILQAVHARCLGPQYSVILRKMLRVVECLPFTPDHIHTASSAQGSFGDVLDQLAHHADLEVCSSSTAARPVAAIVGSDFGIDEHVLGSLGL